VWERYSECGRLFYEQARVCSGGREVCAMIGADTGACEKNKCCIWCYTVRYCRMANCKGVVRMLWQAHRQEVGGRQVSRGW